MLRLFHELRIYLFVFRWFVFLTVFLFYIKVSNHDFSFFYLLIGINIVYTALLSYPLPKKVWVTLILFDVVINVFLIVQTGLWNSPFTLYAYTTLFWLGTYLGRVTLIVTSLFFFVSCSLLPKFYSNDLTLPHTFIVGSKFLLGFTTWLSLFLLSIFYVGYFQKLYLNLVLLYLFQKRLPKSEQISEVCSLTEKVLKRAFGVKQAFLCFFHDLEKDGDWKRQYYRQALIEHGVEQYTRSGEIRLTDYTGKEVHFFLFPLYANGKSHGVILIQLKEKQTPSRFYRLFIRLISVSIFNQRKQIQLKHDMAKAMHLEMRKKLAQDMHDGLAQQLFFLSAQLFRMKQNMSPILTEQTEAMIDQMEQRIKSCHLEVRDYIYHLRDNKTSSHIFDAVEQLIKRITSGNEIKVSITTRGRVNEESLQIMDTIYRLVEEATSNVIKHATASKLDVSIEVSSVQWTIKVKDDGEGFSLGHEKNNSFGILGMRERVHQVGGNLLIRSQPNDGTEIIVIIPRRAVEMYV